VLPALAALPRLDELRRALKARPGLAPINQYIRELLRRAEELRPPALSWSHPEAPAQAAANAPRAERPFWSRFLATQLFHGHIGALLDRDEVSNCSCCFLRFLPIFLRGP
jgi:hypothetical protein